MSVKAHDEYSAFYFSMEAGNQDLLKEKKELLSDLCRTQGGVCELRETHMSWLFLGAERVYKLKKPVRYPFLDFSSVSLRHHFCLEELRLNRRLASGTYLAVLPVCRTPAGSLRVGDGGEAIDWVVEMFRLSDCDMLDHRMQAAAVGQGEIQAVARLLSRFYGDLVPEPIIGADHLAFLLEQLDVDAEVLCRHEFGLTTLLSPLLAEMRQELRQCSGELCRRIASGWFREGHGDLRPEHVWLGQPLQIIDCLEFNRKMRIADPYAEIAQLGIECDIAGYSWIGDLLAETLAADLGGRPSERLMRFYAASRALRRARLCMAHLLERTPRAPEKWRPLALTYIDLSGRIFTGPRQRSVR